MIYLRNIVKLVVAENQKAHTRKIKLSNYVANTKRN